MQKNDVPQECATTMDGKETVAPGDSLQKRISEPADKDLVLMVTLDRREYHEDVLKARRYVEEPDGAQRSRHARIRRRSRSFMNNAG